MTTAIEYICPQLAGPFERAGINPKIFPISPDTKRPALNGWQAKATDDAAQIAEWNRQFDNPAWAIYLAGSGLIGVELDPKARKVLRDKTSEQVGMERAAATLRHYVETRWGTGLPPPLVRSRSGGAHWYLLPPPGVDVTTLIQRSLPIKCEGFEQSLVDTRCQGFMLIPPSTFGGSAYTVWPGAESAVLCQAWPQLIDAMSPRVGVPGAAPPETVVKPGSYDLRDFCKYVVRVHNVAGMSRDVWMRTIFAMVAQFGRNVAWHIAHAIHDGEPETNYQIDDLVNRASEEWRPGDSTVLSIFKHAREHGIRDKVRKSLEATFNLPAEPLDIEAILEELDAEQSAPPSPLAITITPPPATVPANVPPAPVTNRTPMMVSRADAEFIPGTADEALTQHFVRKHGHELRYVAKWGQWLFWNGMRWCPDDTLRAYDLARTVCREEAHMSTSPEAIKIASAQKVAAVERMAKADRAIAATVDQWDAEPWALNTPGGVVNLRTGEMHTAEPSHYCSKITAVAPGGECPTFLAFLHRVLNGDGELIGFVRRALGYALTGVTVEHALFFAHGTGGNGKSVLLSTVAGIFGDYATTAPMTMFTASPHEQHPTDLASLRGARLVTATETEEGKRWDEAKIKVLTGGDKVSARFMRQDFFEYVPSFKLMIAGNHRPGLRNVDEAMRRRLHLLPFTVTIPAGERDPHLGERLRAEWPGILLWMLQGCREWQTSGLQPPAAVQAATDDYLDQEDALGAWIQDACERDLQAWSSSTALFRSWKLWAEAAGEWVGTQRRFVQGLCDRGFDRARTNAAQGIRGIKLKVSAPEAAPTLPMVPGWGR